MSSPSTHGDRVTEKPAHTPGPWTACQGGRCQCKTVSCDDHPIAKVISGKWGDDYPAIRLVGESSLEHRAEAYMDQITYGEIPEDMAVANARLISRAYLLPEFAEAVRMLFPRGRWARRASGAVQQRLKDVLTAYEEAGYV